MKKVITYGTFDLLHYGHIRLLERAKALGDYLIVGVTADDFDKIRGKINVQQSLMERVEAVRATGIADEIIIEEYEGQKIDDIRHYNVDIFTVGSDWAGKFDYLNKYCKVVYLERTQGVSSSELRTEQRQLKLGLVGEYYYFSKFIHECKFVNGVAIAGACVSEASQKDSELDKLPFVTDDYDKLLQTVDAVYIVTKPSHHYDDIKKALLAGKHVLCESPMTLNPDQCEELMQIAQKKNCILMEALKTAYSTAYSRLLLLTKSGRIGKVISVDATCTSLQNLSEMDEKRKENTWNTFCAWGPTALLPVFQLLGQDYANANIISKFDPELENFDLFSKINFIYDDAVASIKVGKGVKSEGELIISGTDGYVYVPAPWWKTEYFEIRYERPENNKRYFYQLDGEGIRYEIVSFLKSIENGRLNSYISRDVSVTVAKVMDMFYSKKITVIK